MSNEELKKLRKTCKHDDTIDMGDEEHEIIACIKCGGTYPEVYQTDLNATDEPF